MLYKRVLLKLSGESLIGEKDFGISKNKVLEYAKEIESIVNKGLQVALVIGGGNIFRGVDVSGDVIDRVQGDHMGMLATVINGLALQSALEKIKIKKPKPFYSKRDKSSWKTNENIILVSLLLIMSLVMIFPISESFLISFLNISPVEI